MFMPFEIPATLDATTRLSQYRCVLDVSNVLVLRCTRFSDDLRCEGQPAVLVSNLLRFTLVGPG